VKKILFVLMACVLCIGLVGGAFAYFSDTETSEDNVFTAGTLDLQVDKNPDGSVKEWVDDSDSNFPTYNNIYGALVDALKPGDTAHTIVGIKNAGTIDGTAYLTFTNVVNYENGQNEPEAAADATAGATEGELGGVIMVTITYDGGTAVTGPVTLDSLSGTQFTLGPLGAGVDTDVTIDLAIDGPSVGNEIQSDKVEFDIVFGLEQ
jgi:predicted ribosomally synthesized peptide with SipW-like signal peptide